MKTLFSFYIISIHIATKQYNHWFVAFECPMEIFRFCSAFFFIPKLNSLDLLTISFLHQDERSDFFFCEIIHHHLYRSFHLTLPIWWTYYSKKKKSKFARHIEFASHRNSILQSGRNKKKRKLRKRARAIFATTCSVVTFIRFSFSVRDFSLVYVRIHDFLLLFRS